MVLGSWARGYCRHSRDGVDTMRVEVAADSTAIRDRETGYTEQLGNRNKSKTRKNQSDPFGLADCHMPLLDLHLPGEAVRRPLPLRTDREIQELKKHREEQ